MTKDISIPFLEQLGHKFPDLGLNPRPPASNAGTLEKSRLDSLYYYLFGDVFMRGFSPRYNTALSSAPQVPLCRRMLGSNPGQLRLRHWLSDARTTRLDLIHNCLISSGTGMHYCFGSGSVLLRVQHKMYLLKSKIIKMRANFLGNMLLLTLKSKIL